MRLTRLGCAKTGLQEVTFMAMGLIASCFKREVSEWAWRLHALDHSGRVYPFPPEPRDGWVASTTHNQNLLTAVESSKLACCKQFSMQSRTVGLAYLPIRAFALKASIARTNQGLLRILKNPFFVFYNTLCIAGGFGTAISNGGRME